jgi:preprotein translocase subunit SecY
MEKIIESIKNIFKIPDLRTRILYTFGILLLYRLGCQVLVPGIDKNEIQRLFDQSGSGILNMANMFTGGALANAAVFALGIMPYITASIILQILQKSVPTLERLSKEGEQGRNKINRYTRYLTVVFGLLHSWGISTLLLSIENVASEEISSTFLFRLIVMVTLTTGAILIMWLGERITEKGIGNGISLIIFASIVVAVPSSLFQIVQQVMTKQVPMTVMTLVVGVIVATVIFVVFFESGIRKITVQYAKRATSSGQMAGGNSYLPFKVNSAGVIPVIFSSSIIQIPSIATGLIQPGQGGELTGFAAGAISVLNHFSYGRPASNLIFFVATMFFTFFYVEMLFNPKDTADNLKKHGGFIPGIRPGKETQEYIEGVLNRLTFWGGLYLCGVSIVPSWIMSGLQLDTLPVWLGGELFAAIPPMLNNGTGITLAIALGGTSLLIVVSVAMDFVNQVENQLIMRKYDGFTSGSKKAMMRTRRYG